MEVTLRPENESENKRRGVERRHSLTFADEFGEAAATLEDAVRYDRELRPRALPALLGDFGLGHLAHKLQAAVARLRTRARRDRATTRGDAPENAEAERRSRGRGESRFHE